VNGRIVTHLLGDWFSEKYGNFKEALRFEVHDSRIDFSTLECDNAQLKNEIVAYLKTDENSNRAAEFALPTNPLLISLPTVGNLLQDEKARPHIAFGDPYHHETGAPWSSKTHVDMIMEECDVTLAGGKKIMEHGKYIV
jgi:aminopeptidase